MDILLIILAIICGIVGIIGAFAPVIPALPLSYLGLLLIQWSGKAQFSDLSLVLWAVVMVVVMIADYFIPSITTRIGGGSRHAAKGSFVGGIVGMFFPPIGIFLGSFVGALLFEIMFAGKQISEAMKSAIASFVGFVLSTGLKMAISLYVLYKIISVLM